MDYKTITNNEEETIALGRKLGEKVSPNMVITLHGDLGAGKTTFTKGIGQGLGVQAIINSPTFTLLKQYSGRFMLHHFDAYRLEGQDDDLGFEDIFEDGGICVIEWAQFIEYILPKERLEITITKRKNQREMIFHPIGEEYEILVKELYQ